MATDAAAGDKRWPEMDAISQHIELLPEETLRRIAKGPLVQFTRDCDDFEKVSRVWQSLFKTFSTASISNDHTTTSCNTLSAFLDAATASKLEGTRQLAYSHETWISVFEVFLDRFEDSKPKPMKQVLNSLVKILMTHRQQDGSEVILSKIFNETITSIILGEPRSRRKPSLVSLEIFIRKHAILPAELISMTEEWLLNNHERWLPALQEDCEALSLDISRFKARDSDDFWSKTTAAKVLVLGLLSQARDADFASSAGATIAVFFQKMQQVSETWQFSHEQTQSLLLSWATPIKHIMLQNVDRLEFMSNQILYPLFSIDTKGFHHFIDNLPYKSLLAGDMTDASLEEFMLLFTALQGAKKIGLVHEDNYYSKAAAPKQPKDHPLVVKSEVIGQFLLHREPSIRIAALSLLITASTTTKPVTSAAMRALLKGLPAMHADPDPYLRGEILSLTRKLIVRLRSGIAKDQEDNAEGTASENPKQQSTFAKSDSETSTCLTAYIDFLKTDLQPTASYPRHITALMALKLFLESGLDPRVHGVGPSKTGGNIIPWKFEMEIFNTGLLRLLVDLLLDPFEEVRATSLSLMNLFPRPILLGGLLQTGGQPVDTVLRLTNALDRAEKLASNTSRADHADTVARLYHILFCAAASGGPSRPDSQWWETKAGVVDTILKKLEEKLSIAGGLFNASMRDAPLHGYISGLRFIILIPDFYSLISDQSGTNYNEWESAHARIVSICDRIWNEVKPLLCLDSPEGHADEPAEDFTVGPKDLLSYSWRALRESSLLLHAILSNTNYGPQGEKGLKREDYESIGSASFTQLAELRHRGAFSTVSQTFATCCQRCAQSKDPSISSLPNGWYQEANKIVFETASQLTRRSAGLPALVTGILTSKPGGPLFKQVMNDLHEISRLPAKHDTSSQEMELPQVHSMNCLKDIFTNTKLGPHTLPFITPALTLSTERMGSPIWALRNSGLMLFRALLSRMCRLITGSNLGFGGSSGSEPGARISFQKYPGLVQLLSSLLAPSSTNQEGDEDTGLLTERVFPALELIGEKVPNHPGDDDILLRRLVREQLKSSVWAIREHAARVYASLLNRSDILGEVQTLLGIDQDVKTQNYIHGKALCVRFSLRRITSSSLLNWNGQIAEVTSIVRDIFAALFPLARSPFVATALIEVLTDVAEKSIEMEAEGKIIPFLNEIFDAYGLDDVLDYVFDSFHPSWEALSTTRASSLLRRALSWAEFMKILASNRFQDLTNFFQIIANFDSNAGRWLLEKTQDTFGEKDQYRKTLLSLYTSIILGGYSEEIKEAAILNIASILEVLLDFRHDNIKGIDLPWEALGKQLDCDADMHTRSRDMADAELRLQGCLLTAKINSSQGQSLSAYELDLGKWATKLRFAMQEETEFTTRHSAVASLATFGRVLRPLGSPPRVDRVFLNVYLVLYDMLNDDDEELRDIAASTASWVLSYSSVSLSKAVALSPLNAANLLAEFIAQNYTNSRLLCHKIIRYITGQEPMIGGSIDKTKLVAVSDSISELRKESTILFVEEKQNLFIDEVREVNIWPSKLLHLDETAYDETTIKHLSAWVSGGLECLTKVTADDAGKDGLMGWASKPEIFTLGMRVINIAAVLVSREFSASGYLGESRTVLEGQLKSLLESGKAASLHDEWLLRIQAALEMS